MVCLKTKYGLDDGSDMTLRNNCDYSLRHNIMVLTLKRALHV